MGWNCSDKRRRLRWGATHRSHVPVKIDLGAGPSDTGMDFETTIQGDSGSAVAYRGPMSISGAVAGPGLHRYTINLVYEVT